jgi:hypothetical protein
MVQPLADPEEASRAAPAPTALAQLPALTVAPAEALLARAGPVLGC